MINSLGTSLVGRILSYVGNHGIADLTPSDTEIATGKGWTLNPA